LELSQIKSRHYLQNKNFMRVKVGDMSCGAQFFYLSQALKTNFINNNYLKNGIKKCFEEKERQEKVQVER
jgi:hypothetical protein